jgi:hypothetical protein
MFDELQTWWLNTTPETQAALQIASVVLGALLVGHVLGALVARFLRTNHFDAALRLPGASPPSPDAEGSLTPTLVAGHLVRVTVWAGAAWWLAQQHGRTDIATKLGLVITRTWALATVLVAALTLGSLLANRLIECLQGLPRIGSEAAPARNGTARPVQGVAGAVGAGAYVLVVLLAILITADLFDWPLTRSSALALWQFAQHLLVAGAALLIGSLGARWARDLVTPEAATSPEKRAGQYTAMGIMSATTLLAVAVLLSSAGVLIGLAALSVLAYVLWLVRGYLPDVTAGLQLRAHKVREVWFDGAAWQVAEVGFLTTQVGRAGEFCRLQNRVVLEARMHGAPAEAVSR